MSLTRDAIVHLLNGETLTARRKATRPAHHAWVGIVSVEKPRMVYLNTVEESLLRKLHVRSFEVADDLLERDFDIHEEDLAESDRYIVSSVADLEALLERLGVDPAMLAYKSATQYPL